MLSEFKDFIAKGNVMDMAVGIIIGAAFTAIVGSLVEDLINPLIGLFMGGVDFGGLTAAVGDATFTYGKFIMAIINFIIIALRSTSIALHARLTRLIDARRLHRLVASLCRPMPT